jgi:hypothetical protein
MRAQLVLGDEPMFDSHFPFPGQNDPDGCLLEQYRRKQRIPVFHNGISRVLNSGNPDIQMKMPANSRPKRPVPNFRPGILNPVKGISLKKSYDRIQGNFEKKPLGIRISCFHKFSLKGLICWPSGLFAKYWGVVGIDLCDPEFLMCEILTNGIPDKDA